MRALDYLETRPDIDATKAGITGRSGGGAVTWFTAAIDERFKAAVPVHGTWSVGPHVAHDVVRQNCDCIYFWNPHQIDLPLAGALIAPRPLKIVNAGKDGAFPPEGYRPVYECLRRVYEWYGAGEKVAEFEQETGHQDLPSYQEAADQWLNRWIRLDPSPYREAKIEPSDAGAVRVLDRYPSDARNEGIDRTFVRVHSPQTPETLDAWKRRRKDVLAGLRTKVFHSFPQHKVPFQPWKESQRMWTQNYTDAFNVEFTTDDSVRVQGQLFLPKQRANPRPALIFARGKDDLIFGVDYDRLLSAFAEHVVLVLNPRAVDYPMDNFRVAATQMTAALLGSTIETMQLWDILRSIDYLLEEEKLKLSSISLYGRKQMGGLALHAAALDDRITRVILEDAPGSHWQGPPLLGVLRVTDLAEVAGAVAPREIVSLTPPPDSFRLTSAIYRLYGRREGILEAHSLGDALRK